MNKIDTTDTLVSAVLKLTQGDDDAGGKLFAMGRAAQTILTVKDAFRHTVLCADRAGLYGAKIVRLHDDVCRGDSHRAATLLLSVGINMVRGEDLNRHVLGTMNPPLNIQEICDKTHSILTFIKNRGPKPTRPSRSVSRTGAHHKP